MIDPYHNYFEFRLSLRLPSGQGFVSAFNVQPEIWEHYKCRPYDACSDGATAALFGGVTPSAAAQIDCQREALAESISRELTKHILDSIKAQDTVNGYPKERKAGVT